MLIMHIMPKMINNILHIDGFCSPAKVGNGDDNWLKCQSLPVECGLGASRVGEVVDPAEGGVVGAGGVAGVFIWAGFFEVKCHFFKEHVKVIDECKG